MVAVACADQTRDARVDVGGYPCQGAQAGDHSTEGFEISQGAFVFQLRADLSHVCPVGQIREPGKSRWAVVSPKGTGIEVGIHADSLNDCGGESPRKSDRAS